MAIIARSLFGGLLISAAAYFITVAVLNFIIYGELMLSPIIPTCCAGI